ncbi:DUF2202 domain-containing protein [Vibrio breoganii]|uniref:DUF2202 domain-containing protein n=1 Tax=Vibrio breoganii TaxID=553239 RepID=UPI000C83A9DF|nr:DUF2202 domain-containing protein [Vibrio breoganii]PML25368.1 hypothetical protein BCT82_12295 [Vibrio breoganii]TKG27003.1 DUF2202 domain-containing protein [Vibrio breoganii]
MKILSVSLAFLLLLTLASNGAYSDNKKGGYENLSSVHFVSEAISEHERLHLIFMREEEKFARDVYIKLSIEHPETRIFGKIAIAETHHTGSVFDALLRFNIDDPVVNDNVGVFSGEEFGPYFTEKYTDLTNQGLSSELDALYVGAFIEELDMLDIKTCPKVMIEEIDSIKVSNDCGLIYTNDRVISSLYGHLIAGSEDHLKAFVYNIEKYIGEGAYQAQVLPQEDIDDILGR